MSRYKETSGYLIHQREYSNTSLIIEFYSPDSGGISLIAKGIKLKKSDNQLMRHFDLLKIQYTGKSQLKTLTQIDVLKNNNIKDLIPKTAALYLNELLRYSLSENHVDVELYDCYEKSLAKLQNHKITPILRNFEKLILKYNGYELAINENLNNDSWLKMSENSGIEVATKVHEKLCKVADIKTFLSEAPMDKAASQRLNKFMYSAINVCFSNRKIHSRDLLKLITSR